jgi:ATP-dependent Clp protease ATP-binding subunit ClpC
MTAQEIGNDIGLSVLRNEILFAGIVGMPERAAPTLERYNMSYEKVKETAIAQVRKSVSDLAEGGNKERDALPFSAASKLLMDQAVNIAEGLNCPSVRSEHVLLALMGYNNGNPIESAPALDVLSNIPGLRGIDGKAFSCFKFCEQLMLDLDAQPDSDMVPGPRARENVMMNRGGMGLGTSTLNSIGVDLTQMALDGKLDNVYGRDAEIRSALRTLGRRRKNNPCLIGGTFLPSLVLVTFIVACRSINDLMLRLQCRTEPGVGKTAVAEGIAQVLASAIADDGQPEKPKFKFPIKNPFRSRDADKEDTTSETKEMEYSLPPCPPSLAGARLISIELASLVAGTANRGDFEKKVQNLIKEASTSNVILFIDEIHNLIGAGGGGDGAMNAANLLKPALARGEVRILGATTTPEYRRYIEKDGALERRFQPLTIREPSIDETIEILATIMPRYEEFHDVEYTSNALIAAAKLSDRYVSDRFLPDKAIDLLDEAGSMIKMREGAENFYVTEDAVTEVISEMSGIPIGRLDTGEKARLRNLEDEIGKRIKGQDQAVMAVSKAIRRARSGMRDTRRPVSSFLFVGPTGVGKTELCKSLAETYFGREKDMVRIDMSEYMDRFSVSRLIGAPPGYVGYDEGGQLTEAVRRSPHSVVLFDELEKVNSIAMMCQFVLSSLSHNFSCHRRTKMFSTYCCRSWTKAS